MKKMMVLIMVGLLIVASCGLAKKSKKKQPQEEQLGAQSDTEKLDQRVIATAKSLGEDPHTYRMHIRTDADGAKIYRQLGAYLIVDPKGESIYVPDVI